MVLFGIFNSRLGIGVGIFTINLIYGPLAYIFLAFSGLIVIKLFQVLDTPSYNGNLTIKRVLIIIGTGYLIGFILTIVNVVINSVIYYINISIIIFTAFIGILWCIFIIIGLKSRKNIPIVKVCIITFTFSIGLIYGAFLNRLNIPVYIYYFFFSISFLQISREFTKGFNKREKVKDFILFPIRMDDYKLLKYSLFFQILSILFMVLSIYKILKYPSLFLFITIPGLIFIILGAFLTLASILENDIYNKISSILKIGILLELIMLLIIGK